MLWLTWHMWILLLLAFAGGVITGWVVRSRSDEPEPKTAGAPGASAASAPSSSATAAPTPPRSPAPAGAASAAAAASTPKTGEAAGPASEAGHVSGHARDSEKGVSGDKHGDAADRLAAGAPQQAPGAGAAPKSKGPASETSAGPGAPAPDAKTSPAPDAKSGLAMTAPMQAPGADAGPVTDGPQGETSAGPGAPDTAPSDDLTQIKGLGPKAAEKLSGAGVTTVSQIANWSDADVERYDALINGRGRITRDDWVGQARQLAG